MRWTRRNHRKALKALALALATSAVVAGTASAAQVHDGGTMVTPTFEPITSVAQQYGGQQAEISYLSWGATAENMRPFATQQSEIAYLSWGATAENTLPFQSTREGGPVFMNGLPDGYVGSQTTQGGSPRRTSHVPTCRRSRECPIRTGTSRSSAALEQLVIRDTPDGSSRRRRTRTSSRSRRTRAGSKPATSHWGSDSA